MTLSNTVGIVSENRFGVSKVTAELRSFDFAVPYEGVYCCKDQIFIDFSLTPRPKASRGHYHPSWPSSRSEPIGETFWVPAGLALRGACEPGRARSLACFIDADLLPLEMGTLDGGGLAESLDITNRRIRGALLRILGEVTRPSLSTPIAVEAAGMLLAVEIVRHFRGRDLHAHNAGGLSAAKLRTLEDRLRSDLPLPTIEELAADCGISPRHLAREFQRQSGRTIGEYVRAAGLERASHLLAKTDLPIKRVAAALGFASAATFSVAFQRATGQTPHDVRRTARPLSTT